MEVPGGATDGDGVEVEDAAGFEAVLASAAFQEVLCDLFRAGISLGVLWMFMSFPRM